MTKFYAALIYIVPCNVFASTSAVPQSVIEVALICALIASVSLFTHFCAKALSFKQANKELSEKLRKNALIEIPKQADERNPDAIKLNKTNEKKFKNKIPKLDDEFRSKFTAFVEQNYFEQSIDITSISQVLSLSERQLQRKVKAHFNMTISEYIRLHRLKLGANKLLQGESVTVTALDVGFSSQNYFSQCFKEHYGVSPSEYITQQSISN